jgi:metal-responsive CopG/Arc/MetJ family transcriptional regulator
VDMEPTSITLRLGAALPSGLDEECRSSGRTRSELIRDVLRRELALRRFEELSSQILPLAEAHDFPTDEDAFTVVS